MPVTTRADNAPVIAELLDEAIQAEFVKHNTRLQEAGVAIRRDDMPGVYNAGQTIRMPYWDALPELQDLPNESVGLTPQKLTSTDETATVEHAGLAVELSKWFQSSVDNRIADPYQEAARQLIVQANRYFDKRLLEAATASLDAAYQHDITGDTDPADDLNYSTMIDARLLWGDEQEDIRFLGCHSDVWGYLMKQLDGDNRPLFTSGANSGDLGNIAGVPVFTSDKHTLVAGSPNVYHSVIGKGGALALWTMGPPMIEADRNILLPTDIIAVHTWFAVHRYKRVAGSTHPGVIEIIHHNDIGA